MRKYVPCVLVISFVFLLVPIAQAIRLSPDYRNAVAHFNLGNAYYNTGKYQEAIESYKQVIRIDPDYAVAHFNLGLAYHLLEDRSSALGQYVILKELDIELANELFDEIYRETDREPVPLVTIRQEPREVEAFNSNDIKSESKNARKLAEKEDKWSKWQKSLNTAYDEALKYDKDTNLNAGMKVEVWKRLANEFSQDNPYSTEDQLIRSKAVERMEYWRNYREPTPPVTIQQEPSYIGASITKLRSSYKKLSLSQVQSMPYVSKRVKDEWGSYGHSTINHDYSLKAIRGDKVVVDDATGLMWHQSGSHKHMKLDEAKEWIRVLNKKSWPNKLAGGYAGYFDWRLPTVEEAVSLLESSEKNGDLYIDPVFSNEQRYIWTGDRAGSEAAWRVDFGYGFVGRIYVDYYIFVRPVRSVLSKDSGEEPEEEAYGEVEVLEEEELRKPKFRNITLRSSYRDVSVSQVMTMPNISIRTKGLQSVAGHSTINHNYNLKTIRGDKVVLDHATGLMWHQNGSDKNINYKKAKKWLMTLNRSGYAGYNDWRLPTVEEAASLLEPSKKSGYLCIAPIFSKKQRHIWTGDTMKGKEAAWRVDFYRGGVYRHYVYYYAYNFVRPVRSME